MMYILGINEGHNASACVLVNGKLVVAVSEDRPTRKTTRSGFPFEAVQQCLDYTGLKKSEINYVSLATQSLPPKYFWVPRETFSFEDYKREQDEYWWPRINGQKGPDYLEVFADKIDDSRFCYDKSLIKNEEDSVGMLSARIKHVSEFFNIDANLIRVWDHHSCHAVFAKIFNPKKDIASLIFTMDGGGDLANGSIWIDRPNVPLEEIKRTNKCNIGRMYRYATLILGMKQFEHAYKVMGLAPYANSNIGHKAYEIYADTLYVNGLDFAYKKEPSDNYFYFKDLLDGTRFDGVAFGIQKRTEELLQEWIENGVSHTGIGNVVLSGGVAMNIKANKSIWESDLVENLFVPPGSGDESLSIAAAYMTEAEVSNGCSLNFNSIESCKSAYLGIDYCEKHVASILQNCDLPESIIKAKSSNKDIAKLLAAGEVVARFSGRGEFGPRALGNRSILASPNDPSVIKLINEMIKQRDFWMPFAATIKADREKDYLVNPKNIDSPYMTVAFDTSQRAQLEIQGGLHPYDLTSRPQILRREENPDYFDLIVEFEKITGIGALLNTSFNLHGEAIVSSPEDAISTFLRSGLKHVVISEWLLSKKENAGDWS